ncbi:TolC family protein [Aquimarina agarivorans]|uniref:TolC family protein n=1 Tax=Aquimarina agarivorans TaxID=980584 RepID=UPI000248FD36|nr:TolC family protein [Aquimarina agarivorans]
MFKSSVFVVIMMSNLIFSQKTYTLNQCIEQALAANLSVQVKEVNTQLAQEQLKQSYRNLLPVINAGSDYSIRYGRSVDPNTNAISTTDFFTNNYSIDASLTIFQGFLKHYQISVAKWAKFSAAAEGKQQRFKVIEQLLPAFFQVAFTENLIAVSEEELKIVKELAVVTQKKFKLGKQSQADVYDVNANLQEAHLNLVKAKNNFANAKLRMQQLMNINSENFKLIVTPFATQKPSKNNEANNKDLFEKAQEVLPELEQFSFTQKALKKQLHATQSELFPTINVFAGFGTGFFKTNIDPVTNRTIGFRRQLIDNASQYVGATIQLPIFNQWNIRSRIKQQRLALVEGDLNRRQKVQELFQLTKQLKQQEKALKETVLWSEKRQQAIALSYTTTEKKYGHGLIALLDVLQVKNELFKAKVDYRQAKQQLAMNAQIINLYSGKFNSILAVE